MNYKKIIKNKKFRLKILSFLKFIPDKIMIKLQYLISQGKNLNLKLPKRFTEKLQWYKLYYRDPLMTKCSDKYEVREYIKSKGYTDILVPLYGSYKDANEINFKKLPKQFVLKTNNGSHTNIICKDKLRLDENETVIKLNNWLSRKTSYGREWSYKNIKPKIISEKFLKSDTGNDLVDYKFFCFNGTPYYLYVITDRTQDNGPKLGIYDMEFNKTKFSRNDINNLDYNIKKPKNFAKMKSIAGDLSAEFPHVRVDLYNIDGKIYFGELTFYDGSGYKGFIPDEFDFVLGSRFQLPEKLNSFK